MGYSEELLDLIKSKGKAISTETFSNALFLKGSIPTNRMTKAIEEYANGVNTDEIYFLMDTTAFGSGKNGILFTDKAIYFKGSLEKSQNISYVSIDRCEVIPAESGKDEDAVLLIHIKGWGTIKIERSYIYKTALAELLESIVALYNRTYDSALQTEYKTEYSSPSGALEKTINETDSIVIEGNVNSQSTSSAQMKEEFTCSNCGAEIAVGDVFCQKCGVKIGSSEAIKLPPVVSDQPMPVKKKWTFWLWLGVSIVILILLFRSCGGSGNYIKVVKQWDIFEYGYSYNDVVTKYMTSVKWKERKQSKDLVYIDTIGRLKDSNGNNHNLTFTVEVTPLASDKVYMKLIAVEIDGKGRGSDTAADLLEELYDAYNGNYATYAAYMAEWYNITIFELEDFWEDFSDAFWKNIFK